MIIPPLEGDQDQRALAPPRLNLAQGHGRSLTREPPEAALDLAALPQPMGWLPMEMGALISSFQMALMI